MDRQEQIILCGGGYRTALMFLRSSTYARIVAIGAFALSGFGLNAAGVSNESVVGGVRVSLAVEETSVAVGQPLSVAVTLENVSPEPIVDVTASFQFSEGNDVAVTVQPPGELPYRYAGALEEGAYPAISLGLEKNKAKTARLMLLYDREQPSGYVFPQAGVYQVGVDFSFTLRKRPEKELVSLSPTDVTVYPATGSDAAALALIKEPAQVQALHLGTVPTTTALYLFTMLMTDFLHSDAGALARRAVGFSQVYAEDTATALRGAGILTEYLKGVTPAGDNDRIAWYIARGYHTAGQYDQARQWMFYLQRQYPESIYLNPLDPLVHYYLTGPRAFAEQVPWYLLKQPWIIPGSTAPTDLRPMQEEY